jgi:hypothetical protein
MSRSLNFFGDYRPAASMAPRTEAEVLGQMSLRDFIASPAWDVVKQIAADMREAYDPGVPSRPDQLVNFVSGNVVRSAINEFLSRIEQEAGAQ